MPIEVASQMRGFRVVVTLIDGGFSLRRFLVSGESASCDGSDNAVDGPAKGLLSARKGRMKIDFGGRMC